MKTVTYRGCGSVHRETTRYGSSFAQRASDEAVLALDPMDCEHILECSRRVEVIRATQRAHVLHEHARCTNKENKKKKTKEWHNKEPEYLK